MSSAVVAPQPATRAELEALPEHLVGELIEGVLYTAPRPRAVHANIGMLLGGDINGAFQRGRGGPGGWWILAEPGIELAAAEEIVPDLAGWRRERLPELPQDRSIQVVPDWVCEILSPSTRQHDLLVKRPFYARAGVDYMWLIDPLAQTLTVSQRSDGRWLELGIFGGAEPFRAEPFAAIELSMADWWAPPAAKF